MLNPDFSLPPADAPTVSICIPTFNNAPMLNDAIQSALEQTYPHLDIWVVDNCSTDDTEEIVRNHIMQDSRLQYFRQSSNVGMQGNFNTCLACARGEFLLILCSDDALEPGCVCTLVAALVAHPSSVLAACARTFTNANLEPLKVVRSQTRHAVVEGLSLLHACVAQGNRIGEPSAVLFRKDLAKRGFSPNYSQLLDLEMWMHLATRGSAIFVPEPLSRIRQHSAQATITNFRSGRLIEEKQMLFTTQLDSIRASLPIICKIRWDLRMAVSVARVRLFGGVVNAVSIREIFFRPIFLAALLCLNIGWPFFRIWFLKSVRRRSALTID